MSTHIEMPSPTIAYQPAVMKRQGDLGTLLRLVRAELFILCHRLFSQLVMGLAAIIVLGFIVTTVINTASLASKPASEFTPPLCSDEQIIPGCVHDKPTLVDKEHFKTDLLQDRANNLSLPGSLFTIGVSLETNYLSLLLLFLIGPMIGGEYTLGTIRLLFTRGPTRLQTVMAKILAIFIVTLIAVVLLTLLGVLLGELCTPVSGSTPDWRFLTMNWIGHAALFLLEMVFAWFITALMAIFFGTLGRSTVVAVVAPFIWSMLEFALTKVIDTVSGSSSDVINTIIKAIPNYMITNNVNILLLNQAHRIAPGIVTAPTGLPDLHAFCVLVVYSLLFIGVSCWLTSKRDVTN